MKKKRAIQKRTFHYMVLVLLFNVGVYCLREKLWDKTDPMMEGGEWHTVSLKSDGTVWAWGAEWCRPTW